MAKCTKSKTKCPNRSCGPQGLNGVKKFMKSPAFLTYYLLIAFIFIALRVYYLPYVNNDWFMCKIKFTLFAIIQWIVFYIAAFLTITFIQIIIKFVKLIISWVQKFIKRRSKRTLLQRILVVLIKIGIVLVLMILVPILFFFLSIFTVFVYYTFGLFMGYTQIGNKNTCILDKSNK